MAKYPWKRLWYTEGSEADLEPEGFLVDPESTYGRYFNRQARRLEDLSDVPCLVLLGEPGMGKTEDLHATHERLVGAGHRSSFVELGRYRSEDRLIEEIFGAPVFEGWQPEKEVLHLHLDSLDEGLLGVDVLHCLLSDELRRRTAPWSRARLRLRLTCRAALWPPKLEDELRELWPAPAVATYYLAPLSRGDVEQAAKVEDLDGDVFLEEISRANAGPLAAKPITLRMLFDLFQERQHLPESQIDLYERGCRALCCESNQDRRTRKAVGKLDPDERLECASRIAAAMVLANRRFVQLEDHGPPGDEAMALPEVLGSPSPDERSWRERELREVLEVSGLFRGAGAGRMEWAHQTYAEFLAARYLHRRGLVPRHALQALTHPEHTDRGVVPGLQGTAVWLASMSIEIFDRLLESEPSLLLQSDVATAEVNRKTRLVEAILQEVEAGDLHFSWHLDPRRFHRLNHPELVRQLRPLLADPARSFGARLTAIRLANACKCGELQDDLLRLALDSTEGTDLRVSAIHALSELADVPALERLRSLLAGSEGSKDDHRIGVSVVEVLWPKLLAASELFEVLARAEVADCLGEYSSFLYGNPARHLGPKDVPLALTWLAAKPYRRQHQPTHKSSLVLGVLEKAWQYLDETDMANALAKAVLEMFRHFRNLPYSKEQQSFLKSYQEDSRKRHRLLMALLEVVSPKDILRLRHDPWPIVSSEDCTWSIELFEAARFASGKETLARLIAATADRSDSALFERLYPLVVAEPALRAELLAWFGPIEVDSELAEALKSTYEHEQATTARQNEEEARRATWQPVAMEVDALLDRAEAGEVELWWRINLCLGLNEERAEEVDEHHGQVTEAPGWAGADPARQRRLVAAARRYLQEADPHSRDWLDDPRHHTDRRPMAAYRAFRLLLSQDPVFFEGFSFADWERWTPAILYFLERGSDDLVVRQTLFGWCYRSAPKLVIDILAKILDRVSQADSSNLPLLEEIGACFDSGLGDLLWERSQRGDADALARPRLLGFLLEVGHAPTRSWAEAQLVSLGHQTGHPDAVLAACLLLEQARDCGWDLLWPVFRERPDFGRAVWLRLGDRSVTGNLGNLFKLAPTALADLFLWFERSLPWHELPDRVGKGAYSPTPLEKLDRLRWRLVDFLVKAGTVEACEGLRRIVAGCAGPEAMRWRLREAEQNLRQTTFPWPTPTEVLQLLDQAPRSRLVRTESELLEVVIESLGRLQEELQGETPAVVDLWNQVDGSCRPKDEAALSDYVKRFLDRDLAKSGVIVNREVEIRSRVGKGGAPGERTDIHVNVRVPRTGEELTVIIEVKGCWNPGLMADTEAQLVDRYLKENQCRHGLYLVGWFHCPQWDSSDTRHRHPHDQDLKQVEAQLDEQSRQLSADRGLRVRAFVLDAALR